MYGDNKDMIEIRKDRKVSIKKVYKLMIQAARWGTYLQHQCSIQRDVHRMIHGLWKSNFPDQKRPDDLFERIEEFTDGKTGKTFQQLASEMMLKDWASAIPTHGAGNIISQINQDYDAGEFLNMLSKNVEEMREAYNDQSDQVYMMMEAQFENLHLN
jgi:hypothetical protein